MKKDFNIIISGIGGQGLITLLRIISQAALAEGFAVRSSELHGLSQRGGSVETHLRFAPEVHSPLVLPGEADLIFSLEEQEALRVSSFASAKTSFLVNQYRTPTLLKDLSEEEIVKNLKKITSRVYLIPASLICQEELANEVLSGTYLLGVALAGKILPLKESSIISAIKKIVPKKYLELNLKALSLAQEKEKLDSLNLCP